MLTSQVKYEHTKVLKDEGALGVVHRLGLGVLGSELFIGDHIVLDSVSPYLRRVPVKDPIACLQVGESEVDWTGGENLISFQQATTTIKKF